MKVKRIWIERSLLIPLVVCPLLLYRMLWGVNLALWVDNSLEALREGYLLVIGLLLISIILHEGLHGVGFIILGHVSWRTIRFRFKKWPKWTPYTTCTQPINARAYRQSALLPLLILGVIPGTIGLFWHINGLAFWAILNGGFCTSDLVSFWHSRNYKAHFVLPMQQ